MFISFNPIARTVQALLVIDVRGARG
jgi:hypothetical protein